MQPPPARAPGPLYLYISPSSRHSRKLTAVTAAWPRKRPCKGTGRIIFTDAHAHLSHSAARRPAQAPAGGYPAKTQASAPGTPPLLAMPATQTAYTDTHHNSHILYTLSGVGGCCSPAAELRPQHPRAPAMERRCCQPLSGSSGRRHPPPPRHGFSAASWRPPQPGPWSVPPPGPPAGPAPGAAAWVGGQRWAARGCR